MSAPNVLSGTVHIVDDEDRVRNALYFLLTTHGLEVFIYASASEFLAAVEPKTMRGCIVLDIRMEPMSGLQLYDELRFRDINLPVIFLSGHGDIAMAVDAIQKGAFDFLEKPFSGSVLIERIQRALENSESMLSLREQKIRIRMLVEKLTPRENQVMMLVARGKLNKVIANELSMSVRTVEVHRSRVYDKLQVKSSAEVATMLAGLALSSQTTAYE